MIRIMTIININNKNMDKITNNLNEQYDNLNEQYDNLNEEYDNEILRLKENRNRYNSYKKERELKFQKIKQKRNY